MTRPALVLLALAASAGCASSLTSGAYSPRPFPTAPAAGSGRVTMAAPPPAAAPAAAPVPISAPPSGPAASPPPAAGAAAAVIATAMNLTGIPYRLGGSDPTGFDCSGFVQYVLRQHAIDMPRTVIEQFGVGVSAADIEPGDLVFFQTVGSKASHVGIAIDGASFVHAPNSRGVVRVERLDAPYWSSRFIGARRVL